MSEGWRDISVLISTTKQVTDQSHVHFMSCEHHFFALLHKSWTKINGVASQGLDYEEDVHMAYGVFLLAEPLKTGRGK